MYVKREQNAVLKSAMLSKPGQFVNSGNVNKIDFGGGCVLKKHFLF